MRDPRFHSFNRYGPVPTGAGRCIESARVDHLARHRERTPTRKPLEQRVVDASQPDFERVAVDGAQTLDRRVVVEARARLARGVDRRARTDDEVGQRRVAARLQVRVEPALERVDVIGGDELARLPLEHRIVAEPNAFSQTDRPAAAVVADLGQRRRRVWNHPHGVREVRILVKTLEDLLGDAHREKVADLLRVEPADVVGRNAQDLVRVRSPYADRG